MADAIAALLAPLKAESQRSAWYTPTKKDGTPLHEENGHPFRIHLLSPESDEWFAVEQAWQVEMGIRRANNTPVTKQDALGFIQLRVKCHIAITLEWEHWTHPETGEPVACTPVNMNLLYSDRKFQRDLFVFTATPANYGLEGESLPQTELEDAEKKSESGANGASASATGSQ